MKKITTIILFSFLCITCFSQEMRRKQVIDYSFDSGVLATGLAMNKTGIADDKILHFYAGYFGSNCIQFFVDKSNLSDNAKSALKIAIPIASMAIKEATDKNSDNKDIMFGFGGFLISIVRYNIYF